MAIIDEAEDCDPVEEAIRITEIADRNARELHDLLAEHWPVSLEFIEELMRCAIEEAVGEDRQKPTTLSDQPFPYTYWHAVSTKRSKPPAISTS
jgi:hypothetical protein